MKLGELIIGLQNIQAVLDTQPLEMDDIVRIEIDDTDNISIVTASQAKCLDKIKKFKRGLI